MKTRQDWYSYDHDKARRVFDKRVGRPKVIEPEEYELQLRIKGEMEAKRIWEYEELKKHKAEEEEKYQVMR